MTAPSCQERHLCAAGIRLRAVLEGEGEPTLILHGFTGSAASMDHVARGLAARRLTIRLDLVGHGGSSAPHDLAHYSMESCVAQVAAALDALGHPSVDVIGYSMGGRVALALAVAQPERVRSLLLVGAGAGLEDPSERAARCASDEALANRIERDGLERFVDDWMAIPLLASQRRLGAARLARARAERLAQRPNGLANSLRGMGAGAQPPLHTALPALRIPICFAAGARDTKFAALARHLAERCPSACTALVPDAGHACHLEQPQAFLHIANAFLERARATRGRA